MLRVILFSAGIFLGLHSLGTPSVASAQTPKRQGICHKIAHFANPLWHDVARNLEIIDSDGLRLSFAQWRRTKTGRAFALSALAMVLFYSRVIYPNYLEPPQTARFPQSERIEMRFINKTTLEFRIPLNTDGTPSDSDRIITLDVENFQPVH